ESLAPPSNGMVRSLLSRSRRRSSCADGGLEEPQQLRDRRSQLRPRDDRVEVAEAVVLLGETEVVRELLLRHALDDAGPRERHQGARLREEHVAERREAREDAARRGM